MNSYLDIILAPIITEKSAGMEAEGKYAFKVEMCIRDRHSTKEINKT